MILLIFDKKEFEELNKKFDNTTKKITAAHYTIQLKQSKFDESKQFLKNKADFWNSSSPKK